MVPSALLRTGILLVALAAGAGVPAPPAAQAQPADTAMTFDIPAQSLDAALAQYFQVTRVQLLYDSQLASGRRSSPVRGTFSTREALRRLLQGTGLVARYSRSNAAILTLPEAAAAAPVVPLGRVTVRDAAPPRLSGIARLAYYSRLERELQAYLHDDARTVALRFTARLSIHTDAQGQIDDIRIDRPGRDPRSDQRVVDVLAGKRVSPPPPGIAQPLLIELSGALPSLD